ncbi:MAG: sigma-54-dependent Fis family transcriptional regulator [Phycisphaeraceae bacterium]|nr:sigma-54-dependent Fis family transcriptional regulator [Phycisphaeraceae bacterium]
MSANPGVLIVDDDPIVAESLGEFLEREGFATATANDGMEAINLLESGRSNGDRRAARANRFGVVITDMNMPRCTGIDLLKRVRQDFDSLVPIAITGFGRIENAVEAVRLGAIDYLTKPIVDDELRIAVDKAVRQHALLAENRELRTQLTERFGLANLVGQNHLMRKVYELVEAVAPSRTTVLISGEPGTGKSMIARAIHTMSHQAAGRFVTFACGAIPETLLESELFGHVKGAFTGADSDKPGKLSAAERGTLFIDEINSATPALQLKLLRVLQEKQYEPVGSTKTVHCDVRFILASNQSLEELVRKGQFREDLYYRINVVNIRMPALRERGGDVPILAEYFLEKHSKEVGKVITGFSEEAMRAMFSHNWPGNVRELENAIERAVVLSRRPTIELSDLPETLQPDGAAFSLRGEHAGADGTAAKGMVHIPALAGGWDIKHPVPLIEALIEPERQIILAALNANQWNRQETARQLGINRTTLYKKMKLLGLGDD